MGGDELQIRFAEIQKKGENSVHSEEDQKEQISEKVASLHKVIWAHWRVIER